MRTVEIGGEGMSSLEYDIRYWNLSNGNEIWAIYLNKQETLTYNLRGISLSH